jgi:hypothetical protein
MLNKAADKRKPLYQPTLINLSNILLTDESYKPIRTKENKTTSNYRYDLYLPKLKRADNKVPLFTSPSIKSFDLIKKTIKQDIIGNIISNKLPTLDLGRISLNGFRTKQSFPTGKGISLSTNLRTTTRTSYASSMKEIRIVNDLKEFYLNIDKSESQRSRCIKDIRFKVYTKQPKYMNTS